MFGEKCTKCEAATGRTDGGPASELVGDKEQLLLSPKNRGRLQRKIIGCHSEQSESLLLSETFCFTGPHSQ